MSSGCGDVLSLEDLKTAKKHQLFEAEVITGKQGGIATGADIDYATNQVTGQTQKTMPAILRDMGFSPASFDFTTGGTLGANDRDKVVYDPVSKTWYSWGGALPHVIAAGTNPVGDVNWTPQTDPNLREDLSDTTTVTLGDALIGVKQPFTGAVSRTQHDKNAEFLTVKDFGAVGDGVVDDTVAVQNAINAVKASGGTYQLRLTEGKYRCTSPLIIDTELSIVGEGCSPYRGVLGTKGNGSWLFFDHAGKGISVTGATTRSGVSLENFGTYRNQPTPAAGWAPGAFDWDISINNADAFLKDLMLLNPTKGILLDNGGYGRLEMDSVRGQAFNCFIRVEFSADVVKMNNIHVWPFWSDTSFVNNYTIANLDAIMLLRCDNPMMTNIFTIFARAGLRFEQGTNGITSKVHLVNADFDRGYYGIHVGSSFTGTGPTGMFTNVTTQAETGVAGSRGITISGRNSELDFVNFSSGWSDFNGILVDGVNNTVTFGGVLNIKNFNKNGGGYPGVEASSSNIVRIDGYPRTDSSGPRYGGSGRIYVDEWRSYSPGIVSESGSIGAVGTVIGNYKLWNNSVAFSIDASITTAGTGAGSVKASVPFPISGNHTAVGREVSVSGKSLTGTLTSGSSTCDIRTYDNAYPGLSGSKLIVSGVYKLT